MRRRAGIACMILGAVLVAAALSLFLWNRREDHRAGVSVERILPQVIGQIENAEEIQEKTQEEAAGQDTADQDMAIAMIEGYAYIGYLSIPVLNLNLPVMSEWDYPRLKIAPCRYSGSVNQDDLVISAHNYNRHFGHIHELAEGDEVIFTDMNGNVIYYEVAVVEVLSPMDVEEMTAGKYALTLFTCTYNSQNRVTVRCGRTDKS